MGVVFFPSLPFMGVMLFPSFMLGNVSGEGGAFLVMLSLFPILLCLPLLSSLSPFPSFSLPSFLPFSSFLSHKLFPPLFLLLLFSTYFHLVFLSFFLLEVFFVEGIAYTIYLQDVRDDTSDCN